MIKHDITRMCNRLVDAHRFRHQSIKTCTRAKRIVDEDSNEEMTSGANKNRQNESAIRSITKDSICSTVQTKKRHPERTNPVNP